MPCHVRNCTADAFSMIIHIRKSHTKEYYRIRLLMHIIFAWLKQCRQQHSLVVVFIKMLMTRAAILIPFRLCFLYVDVVNSQHRILNIDAVRIMNMRVLSEFLIYLISTFTPYIDYISLYQSLIQHFRSLFKLL